MRLRHPDGSLLHLAYCSNVHPADDLDGVAAQLERYTARVRERLDVPLLGIGLWVAAPALADAAAADRGSPSSCERLWLEVVTLNGFPYKAFHAPVVKRDVYWPHWAQDARREYTLGLARLLAQLLPDDVAGAARSRRCRSGWREGWDAPSSRTRRCARWPTSPASSRRSSARPASGSGSRWSPSPGCTIETIAQACDALRGLAPDWIGVCLDACHLAVQFETPAEARSRAATKRACPVVKTQVSSALRVDDPSLRGGARAARALRRAAASCTRRASA